MLASNPTRGRATELGPARPGLAESSTGCAGPGRNHGSVPGARVVPSTGRTTVICLAPSRPGSSARGRPDPTRAHLPKRRTSTTIGVLSHSRERATSGGTPAIDPRLAGRGLLVAVVEDHEILRYGLVACLAEDPGIEVTVPGADDHDTLGEHVDIAVVSSQAASRQRFSCPIVVCSDDPDGPRSVAEGNDMAGVVHQQSVTVTQLHATIQAAAAGLRVRPNLDGNHDHDGLDSRSLRLVELVAEGHSTREIADDMSYSDQTIKKLIIALEGRLQARSRAHLVALAIRRGLI